MRIILIVLLVVLLIIGLFYTFAPHQLHMSSGLDFNMSHEVHIFIGIVSLLLVLAGILIILRGKQ